VTFLFTDVEASTRLWELCPQAMGAALARHDEILRSIIEAHCGHVFATGGDGFSAAFGRAADAVGAALAGQAALAAESWPVGVTVRVRMGCIPGRRSSGMGTISGRR
jgi:class 3 adenylate cyclase